jgi:hypothetical protein
MTSAIADALAAVDSLRVQVASGEAERDALVAALEDLATQALEAGELTAAASALTEVASLATGTRAATALLLASGSHRLLGDLTAARLCVSRLRALPPDALTDALRNGLRMEQGEIALADGDAQAALAAFGEVLDHPHPEFDGPARAAVLQRRGSAHHAAGDDPAMAADLLAAQDLWRRAGAEEEADACLLGAALGLGASDAVAATHLVRSVIDGARLHGQPDLEQRGHQIWGQILLERDPAAALEQFDRARALCLALGDPVAYVAAARGAATALLALGAEQDAYGRLATAWATVNDLIGPDLGRSIAEPALRWLRDDLGPQRFDAARARYERSRQLRAADRENQAPPPR